MMIIGFRTVKVAPATTGSLTPKMFEMPADWMIVAIPETSRSALTRVAIWPEFSPTAGPTISGTATAPAYMMHRCCRPKTSSLCSGGTRSTGCMPVAAPLRPL